MTTDGTTHQIPINDANGNVYGLIDASTVILESVYSCSAIGELLGGEPGRQITDNPGR